MSNDVCGWLELGADTMERLAAINALADVVHAYRAHGYAIRRVFADGYILLVHGNGLNKARVYLHGGVWEQRNGEPHSVPGGFATVLARTEEDWRVLCS